MARPGFGHSTWQRRSITGAWTERVGEGDFVFQNIFL
jgi:hypothetical protein